MSVREVAKVAGVSPITVSRVINNSPDVTPETVKIVRDAIRKLDYRPKPRSKKMRAKQASEAGDVRTGTAVNTFALVVPEVRVGFYPSLQKGFNEAASEADFQIVTCDTANDVARQADVFFQLMDRKVRGAAVVPATIGAPPVHQIRQLQQVGIPVVMLHRAVEGIAAPFIRLPYRTIGQMAGQALAERGHRRVAFFGTHRTEAADQYAEGMRDALREVGSDLPEDWVHYGSGLVSPPPDDHEPSVRDALKRMMSGKKCNRPTAVFCSFDWEAEMVYCILMRMGLRVPEDLSIISFGGSWRPAAMASQLTCVTVDEVAVGRKAASLLDEMCSGQRGFHDEFTWVTPLSLHQGKTLADPAFK